MTMRKLIEAAKLDPRDEERLANALQTTGPVTFEGKTYFCTWDSNRKCLTVRTLRSGDLQYPAAEAVPMPQLRGERAPEHVGERQFDDREHVPGTDDRRRHGV
jgi:hypothetical protein